MIVELRQRRAAGRDNGDRIDHPPLDIQPAGELLLHAVRCAVLATSYAVSSSFARAILPFNSASRSAWAGLGTDNVGSSAPFIRANIW